MKQFTKLMSLLLFAAATQYSCINDADVIENSNTGTDSNGNLSFSIEIPNNPLTRANAETSGEYEVGSEKEYKVNSITVYLYDAVSKAYVDSRELTNIKEAGQIGPKINYTADKITVNPGTYNIFVIANGKAITNDIDTQDKFLAAVDATTYSSGKIESAPNSGFIMTNRGSANLGVTVNEPTDGDKVTNVAVSLERVVAKVEITQTQETFPLKDTKDEVYATVKINNFRMLNLATKFYTFRHTAVLTDFEEPEEYTTENNFGDVNSTNGYVIDPYFFKKTEEGAKDFDNADGFYAQALVDMDPVNPNDNNWAGMSPANSWSRFYCLENCMFQNAQMNAYTTGVMFKANIEIAPNRVFDENKNNVSNPSSWPTKMFYFNFNFYTSVNAVRQCALNNLPDNINDNSSAEELAQYSIKCFKKTENYSCYYNYWIKHLDNQNDTEMGVMEFGIVRNNIYRLSVNKVAGLGSGDPYIEPGQPDEYKAELNIKFDVYPWTIRKQDVELE